MKYILTVQGEGRGHMTQAITMYDMLIEQGHTICAVIVGSRSNREIPNFFYKRIQAPIIQIPSPNFITDKKNKSINITKSVIFNLFKITKYRKSLNQIDELVNKYKPDTIINFFDLLTGLYFRIHKPKAKLVCIAHQYIYLHPDFEFPEGNEIDRFLIKYYTKLTTIRSSKNLALSFYNLHIKNENVIIVPPLLRKEIFKLESKQEDFFLVYLVNNGYFEEIIEWHKTNQNIKIHCFTDNAEKIKSNYNYNKEKIIVHAINDTLFLEMMSKAKGIASTAGFESVCEAMYLGKPVMMVPIKGHYEQFCNSRDAYKAGAGIYADKFDLSKLDNFSITFDSTSHFFKNWIANAKFRIYKEIIST